MSTENTYVNRERRFAVTEQTGFDAIVSRTGSDDSSFYSNLIDFSRNGMKLNVPFCAKFDEILKINFKFKNQSELSYSGNLRVRHIRNIDEHCWQIGCSCDPPLPEEVISFFAKQNNQERRKTPRIDVHGQGSLRRQGTVESCDADILNVSEGGFCLLIPEHHEVGEQIDLAVLNQQDDEELVAGRIRWQLESSEGYRIGCSYSSSESFDVLLDCLTKVDEDSQTKKMIETLSPKLVLAAMTAMLLPSIAYLLMLTGSQKHHSPRVNSQAVKSDALPGVMTPSERARTNGVEDIEASRPVASSAKQHNFEAQKNNVVDQNVDSNMFSQLPTLNSEAKKTESQSDTVKPTSSSEKALATEILTASSGKNLGEKSMKDPSKGPGVDPKTLGAQPTHTPAKYADTSGAKKLDEAQTPRPGLETAISESAQSNRKQFKSSSRSTRRTKPKRSITVPSEEISGEEKRSNG